MIYFNYETDFKLGDEPRYTKWIGQIIASEGKSEGEISFVFCDDAQLLAINQEYLSHDYYTDVISFDYSIGNQINGDVFISVERVMENAGDYNVSFIDELHRVMAHGILHYCGYKDKTSAEASAMRDKEDEKTKMF